MSQSYAFLQSLTTDFFTCPGITAIEKYGGNPEVVLDMAIAPALTNKLNKLQRTLPEAFYYWVKTSELL